MLTKQGRKLRTQSMKQRKRIRKQRQKELARKMAERRATESDTCNKCNCR